MRRAAFALAVLCFAAPAAAASFDCAKARAVDEIAICASPALSELDAVEGAYWFTYNRVPMMMGSSGARHDEALAFLRTRAACGSDAACLAQRYRARIAALRSDVDGAMGTWRHEQGASAPIDPAALPPRIAEIVTGFVNQCQRLGGSIVPGTTPRVMTADLDGDRAPDYVVDASTMRCDASASLFCANNRCQIGVAFSANRYFEPVMLAGGDPAIVARGPATEVTLFVDRTNCGATQVGDVCRATLRWTGGRPQTNYTLQRH